MVLRKRLETRNRSQVSKFHEFQLTSQVLILCLS